MRLTNEDINSMLVMDTKANLSIQFVSILDTIHAQLRKNNSHQTVPEDG